MNADSQKHEMERLNELPRVIGARRDPEVSKRHRDHEVAYFQHVNVLRRHLKPLLRFLLRQVGRRWSVVAPLVEERCRNLRVRRELKSELLAIVLKQIGLAGDGNYSALYPRIVHVDPGSGLVCRVDGILK